jgi:hypothetical protein
VPTSADIHAIEDPWQRSGISPGRVPQIMGLMVQSRAFGAVVQPSIWLTTTGLRFFSVCGPWSRPDMAVYAFTHAIAEERTIEIANAGTYARLHL